MTIACSMDEESYLNNIEISKKSDYIVPIFGIHPWRVKNNMDKTDEGLLGNEKIEDAIAALQQQPTQELLAHALTVVRRRMRENGQVIIAVEPNATAGQMKLQAVKTSDGNSWWAVFTSFDEELKDGGSVMSTFMTDIGKVLEAALSEEEISGVIINPWNRTLMLDKTLIRIVLGDVTQ